MPSPDEATGPAFALPGVDDPPSVEVGVVLLGLDGQRLLAGLALAAGEDDAGQVAVAVGRARHGAADRGFAGLVADGTARWRAHRDQLPTTGPDTGSVRQAWLRAQRTVAATTTATGATCDYLTACWLRRHAVDADVTDPQIKEA